jgi:hypothetical protein
MNLQTITEQKTFASCSVRCRAVLPRDIAGVYQGLHHPQHRGFRDAGLPVNLGDRGMIELINQAQHFEGAQDGGNGIKSWHEHLSVTKVANQ